MNRINAWTDLCTVAGLFRYGSQAGGVPPTPVKAEWLNMLQEELVSVVNAASIELSADDRTQVLQAIQFLISEASKAYVPIAGGSVTGRLSVLGGIRAPKGLPSSANNSSQGYAFSEDGNTGLFTVGGTAADGSDLILMIDGTEVLRVGSSGCSVSGKLTVTGSTRASKGLPSSANNSTQGYAFSGDGDTGLFASGGTATDGSDLVLLVDGVEVLRLTKAGAVTFFGGNTPYHTGNKASMLAVVYPVGSIYINVSNSANPNTLFGFGTWAALAPGRMLLGAGTGTDSRGEARSFAGGSSGGEYSHILTVSELPSHNHSVPQGTTVPTQGGSYNYASGDDVTTGTMSAPPPSGDTGGGAAHNNLSPYLTVYMWQRTA